MAPVEKLNSTGYRKFGLMMGIIVGVLFGVLIPLIFKGKLPVWPDIVGSIPFLITYVFILWSLVLPSSLVVVYVPWMYFGRFMGAVNTRLILGIVYYFLFTPMSLMLTLFGKDPLKRKYGSESSYWIRCEDRSKEHMEHNY